MRVDTFSRRVMGGIALLVALIAFPLGVVASHQFSDVPDSNTFHNDIAAIRNAGVTSGCGGGKYCPKDYVTREQMAGFMNRLGALGAGKTPVVNADRLDGLDSTQLARTDELHHFSCAGVDLQPATSTTAFAEGSARGSRSVTSGNDELACGLHLPDGAVVTGFLASVYDNSSVYEASCQIFRFGGGYPGITSMSGNLSSGYAATPGYTTLATTTISDATIDNLLYTYAMSCYLSGAGGTNTSVIKVVTGYIGAP